MTAMHLCTCRSKFRVMRRSPSSFINFIVVSGHCSGDDGLPWLRILARRDDCICAAVGDGVAAFACAIGTVGGGSVDLLVMRDLISKLGSTHASPMSLLVISTPRTSSVSSSIPRLILLATHAVSGRHACRCTIRPCVLLLLLCRRC